MERARGISRVLSPYARAPGEDHSSGTAVAGGLVRPTRDSDGAGRSSSPTWPCSGWGLPCDPCHQEPGALLPHPFTLACAASRRPSAVCSLWHFPSPLGARALPGTLPCGARTFLPYAAEAGTGDPHSHARRMLPARGHEVRARAMRGSPPSAQSRASACDRIQACFRHRMATCTLGAQRACPDSPGPDPPWTTSISRSKSAATTATRTASRLSSRRKVRPGHGWSFRAISG